MIGILIDFVEIIYLELAQEVRIVSLFIRILIKLNYFGMLFIFYLLNVLGKLYLQGKNV